MAVKISEIRGNRGFFRKGDSITAIDGKSVRDQLDIYYLLSGCDSASFRLQRSNGKEVERRIRVETFEKAAPVFDEMRFIRCASHCIFCFVDQMPRGMRNTLYFKDDDYRLSFLFGNYVTLNDISSEQLKRIIRYSLSPLYVSVHATQKDVRKRLFGRTMKNNIMEVLEHLADGGITIQAQIVLVPGINDGKVLEKSIEDLFSLYPSCETLAIVPVGLTGHREGLPEIPGVDAKHARKLLDMTYELNGRFRKLTGERDFVFMSDEFYLLAGRALPQAVHYGAFEQLENGVGMSRLFIDRILEKVSLLKKRKVLPEGEMTIATGKLGSKLMRKYILPAIDRDLPGLTVKLVIVNNRSFGSAVSVSGLISGSDVEFAVLRSGGSVGPLILPPNSVNHEGSMIDDTMPAALGRRLGTKVLVPDEDFLENRVLRAARKTL